MDKFRQFVDITNTAMRPYLAFIITTLYNAVLANAVITGAISVMEYITAVGPANAMIVGFLFGEKAALKRPTSEEQAK